MKNARKLANLINKNPSAYTYRGKKVDYAIFGKMEWDYAFLLGYDDVREARCVKSSNYYPIVLPNNEIRFVTENHGGI